MAWEYGTRFQGRLSDVLASLPLLRRVPIVDTEITEGVFELKSLADLPEPLALFDTIAEASDHYDEGSRAPGYEAWQYVYREFSEDVDPESPECNEVWVVGYDRASGQPIKVWYRDRDSQNPNLPVSERAENWLGEPLLYGYYSSQLTDFDACARALKTLVPRLTNIRRIASMTSAFLRWPDGSPVWRGDILALDGRGYYEVKSFAGQIDRTPEHESASEEGRDETNFSSMTYVLERLYPWESE